MNNNNNHDKFQNYASQLKAVEGVKAKLDKNKHEEKWVFKSAKPNALDVTLTYHTTGMIAGEIGLDVDNVDSGFWHTEETDLDFHIEMAKAALKGDVAYNTSRIFKFKEVCFKVDGKWECTRLGTPSFGYIKKRRKIR